MGTGPRMWVVGMKQMTFQFNYLLHMEIILFGTMKIRHLFWFCPVLPFRAVVIPELPWVPEVRTITWHCFYSNVNQETHTQEVFSPLRNTKSSGIYPQPVEETGLISSACGLLESQGRPVTQSVSSLLLKKPNIKWSNILLSDLKAGPTIEQLQKK